MNNNELKTLEEKTKSIVATLEKLEMETEEYQKKNIDIVSAIENLANISENVSLASKDLSSAAALFNASDFSNAMKGIDKRIDKLNEAELIFIDQSKAINNIVENVLNEYKNLSSDIKTMKNSIHDLLEMQDTIKETNQLLELLTAKIERIDRNTQKGFGKERG